MGRKKAPAAAGTLTPQRAARLYRLLTLVAGAGQTRRTLLARLKIDVRGLYRDLDAIRRFGIDVVAAEEARYVLTGDLDDALARFPFPDPGLNVRDALQLSNGNTAAHRKLRERVNEFLHGPTRARPSNKPR